MVRIKFRTKKIRLTLIILLIVGVLMLVTGGFMLSRYSSSEVTAAPEPTELSDFKTTGPESAVPSCCANNSEITVPEPTVPSCCGG